MWVGGSHLGASSLTELPDAERIVYDHPDLTANAAATVGAPA
jgi:hypothetical protein